MQKIWQKTDMNIVLTPFKIGTLFSSKDRLPSALRSFIVYRFTVAEGQSYYIGEKRRHLTTRTKEHLVTDKISRIMEQLLGNKTCKSICGLGIIWGYAPPRHRNSSRTTMR